MYDAFDTHEYASFDEAARAYHSFELDRLRRAYGAAGPSEDELQLQQEMREYSLMELVQAPVYDEFDASGALAGAAAAAEKPVASSEAAAMYYEYTKDDIDDDDTPKEQMMRQKSTEQGWIRHLGGVHTFHELPLPGASDDAAIDWNGELQRLLEMPALTPGLAKSRTEKIADLMKLFQTTQAEVAKIIIRETFAQLPNDARQIPSIELGGLAGGEKFEKDGVIFKFARDNAGLYGDDATAAKVAKLELLGLSSMIEENVAGLHFPLQAVIDYMGQRLVATARIPVNHTTIRYGSNDGGQTVHNDASFEGLMEELAGKLRLKAHRVKGKLLWTAGDVEGHQGLDGRRYVLDTARTFPPVAPADEYLALLIGLPDGQAVSLEYLNTPVASGLTALALILGTEPEQVVALPTQIAQTSLLCSKTATTPNAFAAQFVVPQLEHKANGVCLLLSTPPKSAHLVRLLRPEFMQRLQAPLSADAFTGWGRQDCAEHNDEVVEATKRLFGECIDETVEALERRWRDEGALAYKAIEAEVHAHGVNFCFLGRIRSQATHPGLRRALLSIMIARTFRKTVEREVRAIYKAALVKTAQEMTQHVLALFQKHMLYNNDLLAEHPHTPIEQAHLKARLHGHYPEALTLEEWQPSTDLWLSLDESERLKAFSHAQSLLGVKIQFASVTMSKSSQQAAPTRMEIFEIQEVLPKCTGMKPPKLLAESSVDLAVVERTYLRELEIRQQVLPRAHPAVLTVRMHLLGIYSMRGGTYDLGKQVYEQAIAALADAAAVTEEPDDVLRATVGLHCAHFLFSQGRIREALSHGSNAMQALSAFAENLDIESELRSLLHDCVLLVGVLLRELGQYAVAIPLMQQLLDELQNEEDPTPALTLRRADVTTELQLTVAIMGRTGQQEFVNNYRVLDMYRKLDRAGLMYGRCLIASSMMETQMDLATNAVGTLYTAISSLQSELAQTDRRIASVYYLRGVACMNVHMLGDALVHFLFAESIFARLEITEPYYLAPLLADYAKCLYQLAQLLEQQSREEALGTRDMMTATILKNHPDIREHVDQLTLAGIVSSYETMLTQLEDVRDSVGSNIGPCPSIVKALLTAAETCLDVGRTEATDRLLEAAFNAVEQMKTVASRSGTHSELNGDPYTEFRLASVLAMRGVSCETQAVIVAESAATKAARLLGPDNPYTVAAKELVQRLVLARRIEPLLAMGFDRDLCEGALKLTDFDADAAAALLLDGDALRDQLAVAKFEAESESRQEWVMSLRVYHPDTCARLRTVATNILSQPNEEKFRKLRVTNAIVFQHFVSVKHAAQYLAVLGFEKKRDSSGEEVLLLEHPCRDVLMRAQAELSAVLQLDVQEAARQLQSSNGEPLGKAAIDSLCTSLYPTQPDTVQLTAKIKYWLGGPDPLDYISVYRHPGDGTDNIPAHWHYISYGCSDMFGDGRSFHPPARGPNGPSGYGYEITFRLAMTPGEAHPPIWPAVSMNGLARYFIRTGARIDEGHHLQDVFNECARPHAVVVLDPELGAISTPFGHVRFLQLVAVAKLDVRHVQAWSSAEMVKLYRRFPDMGGPLLVADRQNDRNLLDTHPEVAREIDEGIARDGSCAGFVTGYFAWFPRQTTEFPQAVDNVRIVVDKNSARALIVAFRGRIPHRLAFSFSNEAAEAGELARKGIHGSRMLFVTDGGMECPTWDAVYASPDAPFVRLNGGHDVQIYLTPAQAATLADALIREALADDSVLPRLFVFPDIVPGLQILVDETAVVQTLNGLPGDEREFQSFLKSRLPSAT